MATGTQSSPTSQQPTDLRQLRQEIANAREELASSIRAGDPLNDAVRLRLSEKVDRLVVEYLRRTRHMAH